jgi:hypothetical protein
MALPPSLGGATQLTVAERIPATASTPLGVPGTVAGVTAADGAEAGPVPAAFVATTLNVYAVPSASPTTSALVSPRFSGH